MHEPGLQDTDSVRVWWFVILNHGYFPAAPSICRTKYTCTCCSFSLDFDLFGAFPISDELSWFVNDTRVPPNPVSQQIPHELALYPRTKVAKYKPTPEQLWFSSLGSMSSAHAFAREIDGVVDNCRLSVYGVGLVARGEVCRTTRAFCVWPKS